MSLFDRNKLTRIPGVKQLLWKMLPNGVYCFNYHRIGSPEDSAFDPNVFSCTAEVFQQHLQFFRQHFELISVSDLLTLYPAEQVNKKYALITFDDGYRDNFQLAYPLLKKFNIPATLFVATDFIDQKCIPWWDEVAWIVNSSKLQDIAKCDWLSGLELAKLSVPEQIKVMLRVIKSDKSSSIADKLAQLRAAANKSFGITQLQEALFADWDMIRTMANNGITIGSHTCSHRILSHLSEDEQRYELSYSREKIAQEISLAVDTLAYPVGGANSFTLQTEQIAQEIGYQLAFSYINGVNKTLLADKKYQLRRIPVDNNPSTNELASTIIRASFR